MCNPLHHTDIQDTDVSPPDYLDTGVSFQTIWTLMFHSRLFGHWCFIPDYLDTDVSLQTIWTLVFHSRLFGH